MADPKGNSAAMNYPFTPHTWERQSSRYKLHFWDTLKATFEQDRPNSGTIADLQNHLSDWFKVYQMAGAVLADLQDEMERRALLYIELNNLLNYDDSDDAETGEAFEVNEKGGLEC